MMMLVMLMIYFVSLATLKSANALAISLNLDKQKLYNRKQYQTKVTKELLKGLSLNFHWFFEHKLSKFVPYDASHMANHIIDNLKLGNKLFLCVNYLKMIVDGWCLQTRFGHKDCLSTLCGNGPDSLRHLPLRRVVWDIYFIVFKQVRFRHRTI
jgi:hypothetical protein